MDAPQLPAYYDELMVRLRFCLPAFRIDERLVQAALYDLRNGFTLITPEGRTVEYTDASNYEIVFQALMMLLAPKPGPFPTIAELRATLEEVRKQPALPKPRVKIERWVAQ